MAEWNIDMHCQSCVRMTQNVLGDLAVVNLEQKSAFLVVDSQQEADERTEDLLDVGLDARLVSVMLQNAAESPLRKAVAVASVSSGGANKRKKSKKPAALTSPTPQQDLLAAPTTTDSTTPKRPSSPRTIEFLVGGMTCSMCSQAISHTVQALPGVKDVTVSLATNVARVTLDGSSDATTIPTVNEVSDEIEAVGYTVEKVLSSTSDDDDDSEEMSPDAKMQDLQESQAQLVLKRKRAFLLSLVGALPISFMTMILPHLFFMSSINTWLANTYITIQDHSILVESLILAALGTLVQFGSGWTFYQTARYNIKAGQLGMDVLVAIGTTASYGYAWMETFGGHLAHSFETAAVLISFVLLGKWLNSLAVRRTSEALTQLMQLQAKTAILVDTATDAERLVNVDQVNPDDIVKVLRGASLPADGIVHSGAITVDESMMTGESVPVLKSPGSLVLGGTVCVEGTALIQVTGVGRQTALHKIVQLVQEAQTRQVPIQSLADTISSVFVPAVCTMSVLTYLVWYALCNTGVVPPSWYEPEGGDATFSLMFAIATLVISCPCALGLATPTAVMVGTGVAAQFGVLMKGGETLEMASQVNAVVFDKTGTLTRGTPCITDFVMIEKDKGENGTKDIDTLSDDQFLWLFASLERNSEHPLATAVVEYATEKLSGKDFPSLTTADDFQATTGRGAAGTIRAPASFGSEQDMTVAIGNRPYLLEIATISPNVESIMTRLELEGKTAILAAVNGTISVVMGIADELKPDACATVRYLRNVMKLDVWMVTGDNARTARAISQPLGLPPGRVISEALPVAKVQQVKKLQRAGQIVCMVGDGINDSAALAQANVGISLGTGAEIAVEAADMVLVRGKDSVKDVVTALDLSHVIFRRIKLNFVFSLLYNCLGIPVAAGVLYPLFQVRLPPTLAAVAMALSSFSVVSSSLALKLYKPPKFVEELQEGMLSRVLRRLSSSTIRVSNNNTNHNRADETDLREPLLPRSLTLDVDEEQLAPAAEDTS